jgi:hypothetical protein
MTWPKARTWAAAQMTEPGTSTMTTSCSTPGEKRWRNRSAKVVRPRLHKARAKNMPTMMMAPA